jgi:hypothetical protein
MFFAQEWNEQTQVNEVDNCWVNQPCEPLFHILVLDVLTCVRDIHFGFPNSMSVHPTALLWNFPAHIAAMVSQDSSAT